MAIFFLSLQDSKANFGQIPGQYNISTGHCPFKLEQCNVVLILFLSLRLNSASLMIKLKALDYYYKPGGVSFFIFCKMEFKHIKLLNLGMVGLNVSVLNLIPFRNSVLHYQLHFFGSKENGLFHKYVIL